MTKFKLPAEELEALITTLTKDLLSTMFGDGQEKEMIRDGITFVGLDHRPHEELIRLFEDANGDQDRDLRARIHRLQAYAEVAANLAALRVTTNVEAVAYWRVVVRTVAPADPATVAWFYELCGYTHDLKAQ